MNTIKRQQILVISITGRGNFFYEVISKVDNKDWLRFVRTKLILEENLIDDIIHDNKDHVEEQKYQMLLKWDMRQGETCAVVMCSFTLIIFC